MPIDENFDETMFINRMHNIERKNKDIEDGNEVEDEDEDQDDDMKIHEIHDNELVQRIIDAGVPPKIVKELEHDAIQISEMSSHDSEKYQKRFEKIISLPWDKRSDLSKANINEAADILEEDHYGVCDVKETILESLAVRQRTKEKDPMVLCFLGAPGVGKTSLVKSIAKATNREFVKISLSGVNDDHALRGHAMCWSGSHPGIIIKSLLKSGVKNPLILLDEIDKVGDNYGVRSSSVAAGLLEILDPTQNDKFTDHYIDVEFDLSEVLFIATANTMDISAPLKDRMEIIHIEGYTTEEKMHIAKKHILPKQYKLKGISEKDIEIPNETLENIINYYSPESGVRELERSISKICRKVALKIEKAKASGKSYKKERINKTIMKKYLGLPKISDVKIPKKPLIGEVSGLAWTPIGGSILTIESCKHKGTGEVKLTGNVGKNLEESMKAAITLVHRELEKINVKDDVWKKNDIHIHVPDGNPKDGPSAGITIATSLYSTLLEKPIKPYFAMTGEISLSGKVLPVGGIKEKLIAAIRAGAKNAIVPYDNKNLVELLSPSVKNSIKIHMVKEITDVFSLVFESSKSVKNTVKKTNRQKVK